MFALGRRDAQRSVNIWPGFVDGLASLLLVIVFVLLVFVVAQFFLSLALSGRDEALQRLERQVAELGELLSLERSANAELRINVAQLSSELQSSLEDKEQLSARIAALQDERAELQQKLERARTLAAERARELEDAYKTVDADKEKIEAQLQEIAILKSLRDELRDELDRMEATLLQREGDLAEARAAAKISESRADVLSERLAGMATRLGEQTKLSQEAQAKIDLLNRQLASLRRHLARLSAALDAAEAQNEAQKIKIADLGKRLNVALASKVQELARYRSEFFGRLRELLGDRQNIRIVGDRFVFQSEVLFDTASAELGPQGRRQITQLADTLKEIAPKIPDDLDWILRVDGHTDRRPINTPEFPSNWELSTARAVEVVKFLIDQGIPAERLAAAGFGPHQPLDGASDEVAYRRNRRIEFKLTNQ